MFISKKDLNRLETRIITLEEQVETMADVLGYENSHETRRVTSMWFRTYFERRLTKWEKLLDYLGIEWQEAVKESKFVKKKKEYAKETKGKTRIT